MNFNDKTFLQQVVRVCELVRDTDVLDGFIFQDCQILGPAVFLVMDETEIADSRFNGPDVVFPIQGQRSYHGMIGLRNTKFRECRFERIGFAGDESFVESFLAGTHNRSN